MANGHGGVRKGAGRPKKADENRVRDLAIAAITNVYGSEQKGFEMLLRSGEPALVKWVFEHAEGKPTEKIDLTTRIEETVIVDVDDDDNEEIDGDTETETAGVLNFGEDDEEEIDAQEVLDYENDDD